MSAPDTTEAPKLLPYKDTGGMAPFVHFDIIAAHGTMNGAVQIEFAARIMIATQDGGVNPEFMCSGRIRCSPTAAMHLRNAIDLSLKMLEQPEQQPMAASKLN